MGVGIFVISLSQVYCGYESLSYVTRQLYPNEVCMNVTMHPSNVAECPLPPFLIANISYESTKREVRKSKLWQFPSHIREISEYSNIKIECRQDRFASAFVKIVLQTGEKFAACHTAPLSVKRFFARSMVRTWLTVQCFTLNRSRQY